MGLRRLLLSCVRRNHIYWRCFQRYLILPVSLLVIVVVGFIWSSSSGIEQAAVSWQTSTNGRKSEIGPIDVVYTWVNGSDPELLLSLQQHKKQLMTKLALSEPGPKTVECNATRVDQLCERKGNVKICNSTQCTPAHHDGGHDLFPWHIAILEGRNVSRLRPYHLYDMSPARPHRHLELNNTVKKGDSAIALVYASSRQAWKMIVRQNVTYRESHFSVSEGYISVDCCSANCAPLNDHIILRGLPANTSAAVHHLLHRIASENYGVKVFIWLSRRTAIVRLPNPVTSATLNASIVALASNHSLQLSPAYVVWRCGPYKNGSATSTVDIDGETAPSRFEDNEELRYSLRAIEANAPWVRHVFIVTDGQIPHWLNLNCPKVSIVTHQDIFPNKSHLPTFSSPSIESHLHRIPGLSRFFIYLNDDVLFGQPVYPSDFYTPSSGQRIFLSWPLPACSMGCSASWLADGTCDKPCNVAQCDYDAGDCTGVSAASAAKKRLTSFSVNKMKCSGSCADSWIGDRYCDSACNVYECGYDAGDCELEKGRPLFTAHAGTAVSTGLAALPAGHLAIRILFNASVGNISAGEYSSTSDQYSVHAAVVSRKYNHFTVVFVKNQTSLISVTLTAGPFRNRSLHFNITCDTRATLPNYTAPIADGSLSQRNLPYLTDNRNLSARLPLDQSLRFWKDGKPSFPLAERKNNVKSGRGGQGGVFRRHLMSVARGDVAQHGTVAGGSRSWTRSQSERVAASFIDNVLLSPLSPSDPYEMGGGALPWEKLGVFSNYTRALEEKAAMDSYTSSRRMGQQQQRRRLRSLDTFGASLTHVNGLFNKRFGYNGRKVPAHMPHFIDKDVMERLHDVFPKEFDVTSSHKFRQGSDMQFAFSYFYFLMEEVRNAAIADVFAELDLDHSGDLSPGELRSLLIRMYEKLPLTAEEVRDSRKALVACSHNMSSDGQHRRTSKSAGNSSASSQVFTICGRSPWLGSTVELAAVNITPNCSLNHQNETWPHVTQELLSSCAPIVSKLVGKKKKAAKRNKFEKGDSDDVHFMMIRSNVSKALQQLDEILLSRKKFLCMNDNLDHRSLEALQVKRLLKDFYQTLFPTRSQFELPEGQYNSVLHVYKLTTWYSKHHTRLLLNGAIGICMVTMMLLLLLQMRSDLVRWCTDAEKDPRPLSTFHLDSMDEKNA